MPVSEDFRTRTGITLETLAITARQVFCGIVVGNCNPWENLSEDVRDRWFRAVERVVGQCENQIETEWTSLARAASSEFFGTDPWQREPPVIRLAWEAVARHIVNLCVADEDEPIDLTKMEDRWPEWVAGKLEERKDANGRDENGA